MRLKKLDLNDNEFNRGFLRGLIDTDGNYYSPKRRLSFSTTSELLSQQVIKIIKNLLKISPNFYVIKKEGYHDLYTITLHGKNSENLINIIKPKNINKSMR